MTIQEILATTAHRPWPCPSKSWQFYQEWNDVLFLHYQVDLEILEQFVPKELTIDLFEGKAWVSIVVFKMEQIRPKHLPPFPPISNFDEVNIRTYVKHGGKTGVYFLSIEGGNKLSCSIARQLSGLPYRYSKISHSRNHCKGTNPVFNDLLDVCYVVGAQLEGKLPIDSWLTERYALFQDSSKGVNTYEIHHVEWPLQSVQLNAFQVAYPRFDLLLNKPPDRAQYSKGVKALAWSKKVSHRSLGG